MRCNSGKGALPGIRAAIAGLALGLALCGQSWADSISPSDAATPQSNTSQAGSSDSDLAKKLQNPIGDLYSVPFQGNTNFGFGPHGGTQEILNIQPVIPFHLNDDWNIITRTILPLVWMPDVSPARSVPFGTGPTTFSAFLSPAQPKDGWLWGVGPVVQIPTVSSPTLGSTVWGGGVTGVVVYMKDQIVTGALVNNVWSFGGRKASLPGGESYNTFLLQPFFNYNFSHGWYVGTSPTITADWEARGGKWTVPLGANIGRVIRIGKLPVNLQLGAYYNVVKPTNGADWQLRTQITFIF